MGWQAFIPIVASIAASALSKKSGASSTQWGDIERLMELDTELNRTDREGIFSNWNWGETEDGTPVQRQTLAPFMQPGMDWLQNRISNYGQNPYTSPPQFSELLDATMANQMGRYNIGQGKPTPEELGFGPPSADRPGRTPLPYQPQPGVPETPVTTPPGDNTIIPGGTGVGDTIDDRSSEGGERGTRDANIIRQINDRLGNRYPQTGNSSSSLWDNLSEDALIKMENFTGNPLTQAFLPVGGVDQSLGEYLDRLAQQRMSPTPNPNDPLNTGRDYWDQPADALEQGEDYWNREFSWMNPGTDNRPRTSFNHLASSSFANQFSNAYGPSSQRNAVYNPQDGTWYRKGRDGWEPLPSP